MADSVAVRVFDSHCHLGFGEKAESEAAAESRAEGQAAGALERAVDAALERAASAGVAALLDVGIDVESSRDALARARRLRAHGSAVAVYPTAGLHPNDSAGHEHEIAAIAALAAEPEVVAVGETGIDLYWDRVPLEVQRASLAKHIELAQRLGKPVILHCRDAFPELFESLAPWQPLAGVLHCFSGGVAEARRGLDLGLHVSFAGPLTYPKNHALREAAAFVPSDRVLVETDAPFLPPQRFRGKRNEPAHVVLTLACLAECRGITLDHAAEATYRNTAYLFAGGAAPPPGAASDGGRSSSPVS